MHRILMRFRTEDEDCQQFDKWITYEGDYSFEKVYLLAVDLLYKTFELGSKYQGFKGALCDPTTYDISVGYHLGELA